MKIFLVCSLSNLLGLGSSLGLDILDVTNHVESGLGQVLLFVSSPRRARGRGD